MRAIDCMSKPGVGRASVCLRTACIFGLLLAGGSVAAATGNKGWKVIEFPGIAPSRFVHAADGRIDVVSDRSAAMLYRAVGAAESARRYLTWAWRVDAAPPATDLTRRGGDRPLAVHLCFKGEPEKGFLGWMGRVVRPDVEGFSRDHRCLTYVWGGLSASGAMFPNPYMKDRGVMIVLRGAGTPTGKWFREKIDSARDYRAAFGSAPPEPSFLAISGDSDGTQSRAAGSVSHLVFSDR
tara:strand:+ start:1316 stop:2029 length:714 start_codon:yes stop_codon:yes gene_type:complete